MEPRRQGEINTEFIGSNYGVRHLTECTDRCPERKCRLVRHDRHKRRWLQATCHWKMTSVSNRSPEQEMPFLIHNVDQMCKAIMHTR